MTGVLAFDLSLTATGVVYPDGISGVIAWAPPRKAKGKMTAVEVRQMHEARIGRAYSWTMLTLARGGPGSVPPPDLVAMEGYSFASKDGAAFSRAEIRGVIRAHCIVFKVPMVEVDPGTIKVFATGKGNASKVEMLVAARDRLGYQGMDDNEADALWLWHLTHQYLGTGVSTVVLPQTHLRALTGKIKDIDWQRP